MKPSLMNLHSTVRFTCSSEIVMVTHNLQTCFILSLSSCCLPEQDPAGAGLPGSSGQPECRELPQEDKTPQEVSGECLCLVFFVFKFGFYLIFISKLHMVSDQDCASL